MPLLPSTTYAAWLLLACLIGVGGCTSSASSPRTSVGLETGSVFRTASYTAVDCLEEGMEAEAAVSEEADQREVLAFQSLDVLAEMDALRVGVDEKTETPVEGAAVSCCFLGSRPVACPQ